MTSETTPDRGHAHQCWQCDLVIERGDFDCGFDQDHRVEEDCKYCFAEFLVGETFRRLYDEHAALALDSARKAAARRIPTGMTGTFDDTTLTFTADRPEGGGD